MEIGLYNWKTGSVEHDPAKMNVFSYGGPLMSGNKTFKCFDVIQDQNMGFIKVSMFNLYYIISSKLEVSLFD